MSADVSPVPVRGAVSTAPRKVVVLREEVRADGREADGAPLVRVAAAAVLANPYAGRPFQDDLGAVVAASAEVGAHLGGLACDALDGPVASYGKGAIVGTAGEQEHAVAWLTSTFGDALREAIGGGRAWIPSVTKRGGPGAVLDVPLAHRHEIWVRSHYDAVTVAVPDAPGPDEVVVVVAVANRGRLNARLGGLSADEVEP
ncbi:MAG TPA: amino acid synthesis family protein [Acidimicrobiales bacterium]